MDLQHSALLLQRVQTIYEQGRLLDVTLLCQSESFPAHSLVLAAFSNYFQNLLLSDSFVQQISMDELHITAENLRALLVFMYTGMVCEVEDQSGLVSSAVKLGIHDLLPQLVNTIDSQPAVENTTLTVDEVGSCCQSPVKVEAEQQTAGPNLSTPAIGKPKTDDTKGTVATSSVPDVDTADIPQLQRHASTVSGVGNIALNNTIMGTETEQKSEILTVSEEVQNAIPKRRPGRPRKCQKDPGVSVEPKSQHCSRIARKGLGAVKREKTNSAEATQLTCDDLQGKGDVSADGMTIALERFSPVSPGGPECISGRIRTKRQQSAIKSEPAEGSPAGRRRASFGPKSKTVAGLVHCQACDYSTKTQKGFYNHWILKHTESKTQCCPICDKTFKLRKYLVSHMASHSERRPFSCEICNASYKQAKHLARHRKTHDAKPIHCTECPRTFRNQAAAEKHMVRVHTKMQETCSSFSCPEEGCHYTGVSEIALHRHQFRQHSSLPRSNILCEICGKNFSSKDSLKVHNLLHFGEDLKCRLCSYTTKNKHILNSHMMRRHAVDLQGAKPHFRKTCELCGAGCFTLAEFRLHMLRHEGRRPHKCPICDFATVDKGSLKKHIRSHTGETPFKCKQCGKCFSQQSGFARHRRIHLGIKPHKCSVCGKAYADKKTLKTHQFRHLNIKPFICHMCDYRCTKKELLCKHISQDHEKDGLPVGKAKKKPAIVKQVPAVQQVVEVKTEEELEQTLQNVEQQPLLVDGSGLDGETKIIPLVLLLQPENELSAE